MTARFVYYVEPQQIDAVHAVGTGLELGLGELGGEDYTAIVADGVTVLMDLDQTVSLIARLQECADAMQVGVA